MLMLYETQKFAELDRCSEWCTGSVAAFPVVHFKGENNGNLRGRSSRSHSRQRYDSEQLEWQILGIVRIIIIKSLL